MKAVILAAGMGSRLLPLTADRPKPLVEVGRRPLLLRTMDRLAEVGISGRDVIVVAGYREDVLRATLAAHGSRATVVSNDKHDVWNNFWSTYVAQEALGGAPFLQIDGDVLFDDRVLPRMLAASGPGALSVDFRDDLDPETMKVAASRQDGRMTAVSKQLDPKSSIGEYVGVTRIDEALAPAVFAELAKLAEEGLTNEYYEGAFNRMLARGEGPFHAVDISDCMTIEIDDLQDLRRAEGMLRDRAVA